MTNSNKINKILAVWHARGKAVMIFQGLLLSALVLAAPSYAAHYQTTLNLCPPSDTTFDGVCDAPPVESAPYIEQLVFNWSRDTSGTLTSLSFEALSADYPGACLDGLSTLACKSIYVERMIANGVALPLAGVPRSVSNIFWGFNNPVNELSQFSSYMLFDPADVSAQDYYFIMAGDSLSFQEDGIVGLRVFDSVNGNSSQSRQLASQITTQIPTPTAEILTVGGVDYERSGNSEKLTVPFTVPTISTALPYSGLVEVFVTGVGTSLAADENDAFYYNSPAGPTLNGSWYQLATDVQPIAYPASIVLARRLIDFSAADPDGVVITPSSNGVSPDYRPLNDYRFVLDLSKSGNYSAVASLLHFAVADGNYTDNTGAYTVSVYQLAESLAIDESVADISFNEDGDGEEDYPLYVDFTQVFNTLEGVSVSFTNTAPGIVDAYLNENNSGLVIQNSANQNGVAEITLTATKGTVSVSETFTVTVDPINDAPTIQISGSLTTAEDVQLNVNYEARDEEDGVPTVTTSAASKGSIAINTSNAALTYSPYANVFGSDSFVVTVTDSQGLFASQLVNVEITPLADAPVISVAGSLIVDEDSSASLAFAVDDADSDLASVSVSQGSIGTTQVAATEQGTIAYTPAANLNGSDNFVITAVDEQGNETTQQITVTVNAVNDAPTIEVESGGNLVTDEDTPATLSFTVADVDGGDVLTVSANNVSSGSVVIGEGAFTYTPQANYFGGGAFDLIVTDGNGGSATYSVALSIDSVNDDPAITIAESLVADEDTATELTFTYTDVDGDTVTAIESVAPANGSLAIVDEVITYTPAENYNGADSFSLTLSDGAGFTVDKLVSVNVTPVNDLPVVNARLSSLVPGQLDMADPADTIAQDLAQVFDDVEGPLTYGISGISNPALVAASIDEDGFLWVDSVSDGDVEITVTATDSDGASVSDAFTLNIIPEPFGTVKLLQTITAASDDSNAGGIAVAVQVTRGEPSAFEEEVAVAFASFEDEGGEGTGEDTSGRIPTMQTVQIWSSATCVEGVLGDESLYAEFDIGYYDEDGSRTLIGLVPANEDAGDIGTYTSARIGGTRSQSDPSECVVASPDNDSWTRAIAVAPGDDVEGFLDNEGNSRWYKFTVQPGAKVRIDLSGLPEDYDLLVFKDIFDAFKSLQGDNDVDGLNQLSAEFAPSVFSPSVFSPSVFSPSVFSPSVFSPDAYAPSVFSPSVFSPSVFSPSVFSPSVFSPSVFSPSVFSPSVFSPSVFSPSVFSPSVFSPSVFSPSVFSPADFASAQMRSILGVSAQEGTGSERVIADTWNNTGEFYVRVVGKNGAFSRETPFQLDIALDGVDCQGLTTYSGSAGASVGGKDTLILWDSARIDSDPENSEADKAALRANLEQLAARPEVNGVMVDLADLGHIQNQHAQADQAEFSSCPYAENLVAQGIKGVIDEYRSLSEDLRYVVLVGDDSHIPFFRYPDQALLGPEQNYDPPMADGTQSQASLRLNYILGQDEYGASTNLSLRDGAFPIPELAVGRLVETAAEMNTVIEAYLDTADGTIDTPSSTLVTGYDFLTDAALGVQEQLAAGTLGARNDTLITAADISPDDPRSWTADDLRRELLDEGEDIVFLAGHFSANSSLAADYSTSALTTELADASTDLTNSIVFSAGCHSGYNIVNSEAVPGVTLQLDWTQAFAQKGATLIAGTGYQYGDTDFVEYSERLYVGFARQLRVGTGSVSVGEALVKAKQEYLASTPDIRGLHRKSLLISTVFGLPMLSVNMPGDRIIEPGNSALETQPFFADAADPRAQLGLRFADADLVFQDGRDGALTEGRVPLTDESGDPLDFEAVFLQGPSGSVVTNPAEPAIPLISRDVTPEGDYALRGVGFIGGQWTEKEVLPLTGAPATELRGVHTPFTSPVNFPMRLANANYYDALSGGGSTILHVTPAQHRDTNIADIFSTRRTFSDMKFRLYYSGNTVEYEDADTGVLTQPALSGPPTMSGVRATTDGATVEFEARVVGDPSAAIASVWVTYTAYTEGVDATGEWVSVELSQTDSDSTLWTSAPRVIPRPVGQRIDYMVQAVSGFGLLSLDDNFGSYYTIPASGNTAPIEPVATLMAVSVLNDGNFGSEAEIDATLTSEDGPVVGAPVLFSIGGTGRAAVTDENGVAEIKLPLTSPPGNYPVTASFGGNEGYTASSAESEITITRTGTELAVSVAEQVVGVDGVSSGITALLTDTEGTPLLQRSVYFTLSDGPVALTTIPVITDNAGRATLGNLALPAGSYDLAVRFLGSIPTGDANATLNLSDPTYNASDYFEYGFELVGNADCPAEEYGVAEEKDDKGKKSKKSKKSDKSNKSKKLKIEGFCYLQYDVNGAIDIKDGTLIVGEGVRVTGKIDQKGAGSVRVLESAVIEDEIYEAGAGSISISVDAVVDGKLKEKDEGGITISVNALVDGNIDEHDDGAILVDGTVNGHIKEKGEGDIAISADAVVDGKVDEYDIGSIVIDGAVFGNVTERNEGSVLVRETGSVDGRIKEDDHKQGKSQKSDKSEKSKKSGKSKKGK